MQPQATPALPPELDARYQVLRHLGSGGMADVFLARDRRLGRDVAVKVLRPNAAASAGTERFLREVETVARLQHPGIVAVHDAGDAAGHLYFVMPFVDGESLRDRLRRDGRLAWTAAASLVRDVADALTHAHERGVIHRDVKPDNILVVGDHALIADFGIARLMDRSGSEFLTQVGEWVGTPVYMSPEQAFGEEGVDGRTDVYGLACVAYEMLSGEPPFADANAYAILMKKSREAAPPLPPDVAAATPAGAAVAIARSLAASPEARHPTPRAFADAFAAPVPTIATGATAAQDPAPDALRRTSPELSQVPVLTAVLVLPLANGSADPTDDVLCDGISEELIHALSRVAGLRVVARTSAFAFKGHKGDIREVANRLNADAVLEGSLRRSGERLRLTVRLVDGVTGYDRWSERYDRAMADVLDVQDDLAGAIVEAIKGALGERDRRLIAATTESVDAFRLYLEGRFHWNQRTEDSLRTAVDYLRRAATVDPAYADAHAAAAVASTTLAIYGGAEPAQAMLEAREYAERALALRAGHSDALAARACARIALDWDWVGGERDFQRAAGARSASPTTLLWYAMHVLVPHRRFPEAHVALADAHRIDPLSPFVPLSQGLSYLYAGDAEAAVATLAPVASANPTLGVAHFFAGQALTAAGRAADALAALNRARETMRDTPELLGALTVAQAAAGDESSASATVARLRALGAERYVSPVALAQAEAACGNHNRVLGSLERAVELHAPDLVWVHLRPVFAPYRNDARYRAVLDRIGLGASGRPGGQAESTG